jgi:hypothetical protein
MSRENPWTQHRQSFWAAHAGNPRLPLWQRVYCLAYGTHRRNGHAPFKSRSEIAVATQIVDKATGELHVPSPERVSEAIAQAIENGFLAEESNARCLVVPPWAIEGGLLGRADEICTHHASGNSVRKIRGRTESADDASAKGVRREAVTSEDGDAFRSLLKPIPNAKLANETRTG